MEGDRMVLSREAPLRQPPVRQRMTFFDIAPDSLTWDWEQSEDSGTTWDLKWRIHYKRRAGS
jgi:hypothetical protein